MRKLLRATVADFSPGTSSGYSSRRVRRQLGSQPMMGVPFWACS